MTRSRRVLVTGGSGFIGSHTCLALIEHGHEVVVVDDYSNSSPEALARVQKLTGVAPVVYKMDIRDRTLLPELFARHHIDVVIHFAAKKSVPESTHVPLEYFDTNVAGTINILRTMQRYRVPHLVYSSSCSVYGDTPGRPLTEADPPRPTNPYAWTKWTCEQIIEQACRADPDLTAISLRYFNPIGAHPSGLLGESPTGPVTNVIPLLMRVASGQLPALDVYGDDYPTPDGTAIRDYIHVLDVAEAHVVALDHLDDAPGMQVLNIGTGVGTSVLELRNAFALASGRDIPYVIGPRRPGDVSSLIADPSRAADQWKWRTSRDLYAMCRDSWQFQVQNPHGYVSADS